MYIQISYPFIFINYLRQAQTTQKIWLNFTVEERFPRSASQSNMCLLWTLILVKYEQSATWCESRAVTDAIMFSNLFGIIATVWYYRNDQVELIQPITVQMVWTEKSYHLREFLALNYVSFFYCCLALPRDQMSCCLYTLSALYFVVCTLLWLDDDWQETLLCSVSTTAIHVICTVLSTVSLCFFVLDSVRFTRMEVKCKMNIGASQ